MKNLKVKMKTELFDKIQSYLKADKLVSVDFYPDYKGCDILYGKDVYSTDIEFFDTKFGEWFYEELVELLIDNDVDSESITVKFTLNKDSLAAGVTLICSDNHYNVVDEPHYKDEIITPLLISTITNHLKLNEQDFDKELIDFEIEYDEKFDVFKIYYDNKRLVINKTDTKKLQYEVEGIISGWTGPFFGKNEISHRTTVVMDRDELFNCTDIVNYELEVDLKE